MLLAKVIIEHMAIDNELRLGGKEILISHSITAAEFMSGKCFDSGAFAIDNSDMPVAGSSKPKPPAGLKKPFQLLKPKTVPLVDSANTLHGEDPMEQKTYYYSAQWRKPQSRKHKTWDGDATIAHQGTKVTLHDEAGVV